MYQSKDIIVDVSDIQRQLPYLQRELSKEEADKRLRMACSKTGRYVKGIVKDDVPKHYEVGRNYVASAVGNAHPEAGGSGICTVVPIKGLHGTIGEKGRFKASKPKRNKKLGIIQFRELKGKVSTLPKKASARQGGGPVFMMKGISVTRKPHTRKIVRVTATAVPQHVSNQAREDIERDVHNKLQAEILRLYGYAPGTFGGGNT